MGIKYVSLEELYRQADVISLHVPLLPATHHMVSHSMCVRVRLLVRVLVRVRLCLCELQAVVISLPLLPATYHMVMGESQEDDSCDL